MKMKNSKGKKPFPNTAVGGHKPSCEIVEWERGKIVAKRHLLSLPKAAKFYSSKFVTVEDVVFKFTLYTYDNASGFVHFVSLSKRWEILADAKAQYYNRTWEKYTGQTVFKQALEWALKSHDITKEQYDKLREDLE